MRTTRVLLIAEVALAIAMAVMLNFVQIRLPVNIAGGSINLSMLPIALVALRRGVVAGAATGTAFGLLDFFLEPFPAVPISILLDYPVAYLLFGLAVGLFSPLYRRFSEQGTPTRHNGQNGRGSQNKRLFNLIGAGSLIIVLAIAVGGALRYGSHVLSGVIFYGEYAAGWFEENPTFLAAGPVDAGLNAWIYSLVYNISYVLPSLVSIGILALVILPILAKVVPVGTLSARSSVPASTPAAVPTAVPASAPATVPTEAASTQPSAPPNSDARLP